MNRPIPCLCLCLPFFLGCALLEAEDMNSPDDGAAGTHLALKRLGTTASVLHIVAHPDDEDAGTLAYLSRHDGARTMVLSLTRGEGGANLISSHFFDALGVLRTLEFLEACRYYGTELFYTRAVDYGYSKNVGEALREWKGGDELLRDVVRVVRRERPDVIFARFSGTPRDGHGHHQLSGMLAIQAYAAAADASKFPEQIEEGLQPWQAKKLYVRPRKRDDWTLAIDSGVYAPLIGASYYQIGRFGYGFHRCQGILSHDGRPGSHIARYKLLESSLPDYLADGKPRHSETSIFDGIDTSYRALATSPALAESLGEIDKLIQRDILTAFDVLRPGKIVPALVRGLRGLRRAQKGLAGSASRDLDLRLARAERQFENALCRVLGVHFRASVQERIDHVTPGEHFTADLKFVHRSRVAVQPVEFRIDAPAGWKQSTKGNVDLSAMSYNETRRVEIEVQVPRDAKPTRLHYHRDSVQDSFYNVDDPAVHTRPLPAPPVTGILALRVNGELVTLREPVRVTRSDIRLGTRYPSLAVVPAISVSFETDHGVMPIAAGSYTTRVTLRSSAKQSLEGTLHLDLPEGWSVEPASAAFSFESEGDAADFEFRVIPTRAVAGREIVISAVANAGDLEIRDGFETITARDIGRFNLFKPARHRLRIADIRIAANLRVAYIPGSGDEVARSLATLDVHPEILDGKQIAEADLSQFHVILVGVRAYAVREDIRTHNARLLEFVEDGGVLVVQYQTPEFDHDFGPYPYTMRRPEEVSEEDAAVTILRPAHPIFTTPNRITAQDFDGWVEQRGSKFWRTWDERYTPLLECHDQGQVPQRGGMLIAHHGKGIYIYSAYAWYRQLPQGVPGAYRILANILSLKREP